MFLYNLINEKCTSENDSTGIKDVKIVIDLMIEVVWVL